MARGINKVILIGNVGNDPEVRYMQNGNPMTTLSIATSESWKDKQTGEKQDKTEWHRVVCFNRLSEIIGEYVHKGSKLYIEGSLRTRKWQDQQKQDRYITEIIANDIQILDNKTSSNANTATYDTDLDSSSNSGQVHQQNLSTMSNLVAEELDDDVPF